MTAAEIGLAADIIIEPEFVSDQSAAASIQPGPENVNQSSLRSNAWLSEPDLSLDKPLFADAELSENLAVTEGESLNDAPPVTEDAARAEDAVGQGKNQEIDHPLALQLPEQWVRQAEEPLLQEAILPGDALLNKILDEETRAAVPEIADVTVAIQKTTPVETELNLVLSAEAKVKTHVDSWVCAWQQQLDGYFSRYSSGFESRYQSSVTRWRASRRRVIGNAQWIRLTLYEYEVINELPNSIEVHFWLDYESPTYSDFTKEN